jgi:hypothetical protein
MKKLMMTTAVLAMLTGSALADGRHRGYQGHGGRGWAAPLVGGLIVGGIIGGGYYYNRGWYTECRLEPVYDRWGNIIADQQVCYRVQN